MQWSTEERPDALIAHPVGRVDEASWQDFAFELGQATLRAADTGAARLILDLSRLDYMSSRGLRALTLAKRDADAAGVALQLAAPNEVMREILAISRYDKLFTLLDSIPPVG